MVVESAEERAISLRGVPVVDVTPLIKAAKNSTTTTAVANGNNNELKSSIDKVVKEISEACKNWGFFYVVGHGIDREFVQTVRKESAKFIYKPKEFKRTVVRKENNARGYFDAEYTKQTLDWKEGFDVACLDGDLDKPGPDGVNQWPEGMPEFKAAMTRFFEELGVLAHQLVIAMWKGLGGDLNYVKKQFENNHTGLLRINYYGKCPKPDIHFGVGPHTDPGAVTVLLQDDDVNSLQVQRNGAWYNVPPIPDSFVINTGDMFQVWSNGLYQAPVHRVLANKDNERYSFPFFYNPSYDTMVAPLDQTVTKERPLRYKPINWGDFRFQRFAGDYADVGEEIQIAKYEIK